MVLGGGGEVREAGGADEVGTREELWEGVGGPADDADWFVVVVGWGWGGWGEIVICELSLWCGWLWCCFGFARIREVPHEFIEAG